MEKQNAPGTTLLDLKSQVVRVEKRLASLLGMEMDAFRQKHGDKLANEMLMSVSALLGARTVTMLHVWTGEPIESIRKRYHEALNHDIKPSLAKMMDYLANQEEKQTRKP